MLVDRQGRITRLDKDDKAHSGHSVCNTCKKDMPYCWDVVCKECGGTFCYSCSVAIDPNYSKIHYWYCLKCAPVGRLRRLWFSIILFIKKKLFD